MNNPWNNLSRLTQIRVANTTSHNLYWFKDVFENYGLLIQCKVGSFSDSHNIPLKGIQIEIDHTEEPNKLLLVLKNKEDWEIFKILCEDLVAVVADEMDDMSVIHGLSRRLTRWQKLLQYDLKGGISPQKQKGLFSELLILKDVIATKYSYEEAVENWTGPLFQKQDFIMEKAALEVKSYSSSKAKKVKISSKEQLDSPKENLFLAAVALSESRRGKNITQLVDEIKNELTPDLSIIFDDKLGEYGYAPEIIKEPLIRFLSDDITFYGVKDDFPRIISTSVPYGINKIEYEIDLTKCGKFILDKDAMEL
ncbi:PD-(D/E)XK motif protein [Peribacillus butanolivorans]|nr:PD-(D/E)XK motif protein [Peribacillus butanolivorans]